MTEPLELAILYRGPLSSCNYACRYCPFAKHAETAAEHAADGRALERFLRWVEGRRGDRLAVFFTPWGEALVRRRYQQALVRLTALPQVTKAAIQTNLSCRLDWVEACDRDKLALWATFHPSQVPRATFLARCLELDRRGVRFSVGAVGLPSQTAEIEALRRDLPGHVYLWINAYRRAPAAGSPADVARLTAVDPLFPLNLRPQRSLGRPCRTGQSVISVDGEGTVRRCHFVRRPLGNLYAPDFERLLRPRACPNLTCGCHIGYVHLDDLGLQDVFGDGLLERIPAGWGQGRGQAQVSATGR
jgi:MoaA/NifB/PqqE/SkfB family radical SAM enzyme